MTSRNFNKISTAAFLILAYNSVACSVSVKVGSEDPETNSEQVPTDPLTSDAQPRHPIVRWRQEQKMTQQKSLWAKSAQKALDATTKISLGAYSGCAVNAANELKCWGYTSSGSQGKDPSRKDTTDYFKNYTSKVKQISASANANCILTTDGVVTCHGENIYNQLGQPGSESSFQGVVPFGLLSNIRFINSRADRSCALTLQGQLKCWGWGFTPTPTFPFGDDYSAISVAVGANHNCLVTKDYSAKCWGQNQKGQLGVAEFAGTNKSFPVTVNNLYSGVAQVAVGSEHSCALLYSGAVKCWGSNAKGQLGIGSTEDQKSPTDVIGLQSGVVAIALGDEFSCALLDTGKLKCWGTNDAGQLGDGTNEQRTTPVDVGGFSASISHFSAGQKFACALDKETTAWCWGEDDVFDRLGDGRLGDGTRKNSSTPVKVKDFNSNGTL